MDNPLIPTVKYATLIATGDGVKTAWEFNFDGGYISPEHVKAFTENMATGELVIRPLTLIGPNTAQIVPAVADGLRLIIYRDTPKTEPLVDYSTGSILNESSLDKSNRQAVFIAAELADRVIADYDFSNALLYAVTTATAAAATANGIDAKASTALENSVEAVALSREAAALRTDLNLTTGAKLVRAAWSGTPGFTVADRLSRTLYAEDFPGVDSTGSTDSTVGIAMAVAALRTLGGGIVQLGRGTFKLNGVAGADGILNGILVPYRSSNGVESRVEIIGSGKSTVLKAGSSSMILVRYSDSHGGVSGVTYDGAGLPGVWALAVVPENITQTTTVVNQNYNRFNNFYVYNCSEGIMLQCGPRVSGTDSGCWYNNFSDYQVFGTVRSTWLRAPANAASGCNGNTFSSGRSGQGMNTGVQIDSGSGNYFYSVHGEGISVGTAPSLIPTSVKITGADVWGTSNDGNQFFGCRNEANTRDLDNGNSRTAIFGGDWAASKFVGVRPAVLISVDPSVAPTVIPGVEYGEGVPGYSSGYIGLRTGIADVGYEWAPHTITAADVSNTVSVASAQSRYKKLGGMVDWHFTFQFRAVSSSVELLITPPVGYSSALYGTLAARNPFYSVFVSDGTGINKAVEAGWTNTGKLYIKAPAAWELTGNNNSVYCTIRYHE